MFFAQQHEMLDDAYAQQSLDQQLNVILRDDLVFWLVRNRGFHPDFSKRCSEIRKVLFPGRLLDYSEEEATLSCRQYEAKSQQTV